MTFDITMHKVWICLLLFVAACTSREPERTQAPPVSEVNTVGVASSNANSVTGSLEIVPNNAVRGTVFSVVSRNFDLAGKRIEWTVNGAIVPGVAAAQFKASEVKKGDVVQARISGADFEMLSNAVEIKNSPPLVEGCRIMPLVFKPGESIYAEAATYDSDGDTVTLSYEWTINGKPAGAEQRVAVPLRRGDKISIKMTPFDGEAYGPPAISEKEILSMPPVIEEHREYSFDGAVYTYQVKAADPDGDKLTFALASSPEGMTIDSSTGLIKWVVPSNFKGTQPVSITVNNGHGGTAQYNIKIIIP